MEHAVLCPTRIRRRPSRATLRRPSCRHRRRDSPRPRPVSSYRDEEADQVELGSAMNDITPSPVDPTPDEVQYLEDRIYEFNSTATGIADGEWLAFFMRDANRILAGICGTTWGGTCELRQFWVEQSQRGR